MRQGRPECQGTNQDGDRILMTGSAAARVDDAAALAERGVATMIVNVASGTTEGALAKQEAFAADVMGKLL